MKTYDSLIGESWLCEPAGNHSDFSHSDDIEHLGFGWGTWILMQLLLGSCFFMFSGSCHGFLMIFVCCQMIVRGSFINECHRSRPELDHGILSEWPIFTGKKPSGPVVLLGNLGCPISCTAFNPGGNQTRRWKIFRFWLFF